MYGKKAVYVTEVLKICQNSQFSIIQNRIRIFFKLIIKCRFYTISFVEAKTKFVN